MVRKARQPKKGTQVHENGICIVCGEETRGIPAVTDFPIRAARKMRGLLRLAPRHTIVCPAHEAEALQKRAAFEKRLRNYRMGAIIFFILASAGAAFFGRSDAGLFVPALLGALLIAIFPYASYRPKFSVNA